MTSRFLHASLALWRRRLAYRKSRLTAARRRHDRPAIAKYEHLITVAIEQIRRRKTQIAERSDLVIVDGKPVVRWIAEEVLWAREHGWTGVVVSGFRTHAEQYAAAVGYVQRIGSTLAQTYPSGVYASNHCKRGKYPAGAVDVTQPEQLARVLARKPGGSRAVWGGPVIGDTVHFSATGH